MTFLFYLGMTLILSGLVLGLFRAPAMLVLPLLAAGTAALVVCDIADHAPIRASFGGVVLTMIGFAWYREVRRQQERP